MAFGDILVDGKPASPTSCKDKCEFVVNSGLFKGTPEELFNFSQNGDLYLMFDLYWLAMAKSGHKITIDYGDEPVEDRLKTIESPSGVKCVADIDQ